MLKDLSSSLVIIVAAKLWMPSLRNDPAGGSGSDGKSLTIGIEV
jgi:hypothetical protein